MDCVLLVGYGKRVGDLVWTGFRSKEVPHVRDILAEIVDCSVPLLFRTASVLRFRHSNSEVVGTARRRRRGVGGCGFMADTASFQLCVSVPTAEVPSMPAKDAGYCLGFFFWFDNKCGDQLALHLCVGFWTGGRCYCFGCFLVVLGVWYVCLYDLWWLSFNLDWFLLGSLFWSLGISQALCRIWGHALVCYFFCFYLIVLRNMTLPQPLPSD